MHHGGGADIIEAEEVLHLNGTTAPVPDAKEVPHDVELVWVHELKVLDGVE